MISLYVVWYLWLIFFIPVVLGKMGPGIFLLSSVVALISIALIFFFFKRYTSIPLHKKSPAIWGIALIALAMPLLYSAKMIPPIPLALKHASVNQSVVRAESRYYLEYQQTPSLVFWKKRARNIHWQQGQSVYVFSAIFAPTRLTTDIEHVWQQKTDSGWQTTDTIPLTIAGGRKGGYRGYTKKSNLTPGTWRVLIQTTYGQRLGKRSFVLDETTAPRNTGTETR